METVNKSIQESIKDTSNKLMKIGFYIGLASILLFEIGIIPLIGMVISITGVVKYDKSSSGKLWMGIVGIILNFIYLMVNAYKNGHI